MITQAELMEILDYDPNTGDFIWKKLISNRIKIGNIAGTNTLLGYRRIAINNKHYLAHRLAWLYMTGNWPTKHIDHINGIPNDNRFCNLRTATDEENQQNRKTNKNNKSGYLGVSWHKHANKWKATIKVNKKIIHIAYFDDPQVAHQAYLDAKSRLHTFNPVPR